MFSNVSAAWYIKNMMAVPALAIWGKMPLQNIADVNEVGIGKTQTLVGNFFETFLLFTVYSKSII